MKLHIFNKIQGKTRAGTFRYTVPITPGSNLILQRSLLHIILLEIYFATFSLFTSSFQDYLQTWNTNLSRTSIYRHNSCCQLTTSLHIHTTVTANSPHPCIYRYNRYCQLTTSVHIQTTGTANSPHPCIYRHNSYCELTTSLHIQTQQLLRTHNIPAYTDTTAIANSPHPCIYRHNSYCELTTALHIQT
jgi:hypothetical protein